jgi:hypothetical protein
MQMKMAVLWDITLCSLVKTDRRFRYVYCFYHQGGRFNFYETKRRNRGSSASIMYGYGLDDRAIEVRSPAEEKGFFL